MSKQAYFEGVLSPISNGQVEEEGMEGSYDELYELASTVCGLTDHQAKYVARLFSTNPRHREKAQSLRS